MAFKASRLKQTRNSTFRAKIREELICAICLDFLDEPKVLNCAHSFCLACLEQTANSKYKHGQLQKGDLECPSCRQVTRLPSGKVKELNTNHTLKRLVSVVSEDQKKAARELISSRSIRNQSVSQTALNCQQHLRPAECFCLECNELVCSKCISSNHKRHNIEEADKVLPKQIEALRSLIQPACEVASRAEGILEQLFQEKDNIVRNSRTTNEAIQSYFKKIRKVIDQRESALKSTVQKYSDIKHSRIDSHYQMLQNHHDAILVKVSELERLIDDNDVPRLLTQKQTIAEDLEAQEQSVMAVSDLIKEASNQGTLLFRDGQPPDSLSELGDLCERQQKPNSPFVTLRRLVVSEDEDPYLDVPLRFEDEKSSPPQKQVRVDESKSRIEYEPEGKPSNPDTVYNVPQPIRPVRRQSVKPEVPPRRTSEEKSPPLPPRRPRTRRLTPSSSKPALKTLDSPDFEHDYQNFDPMSLQASSQSLYQNVTPDMVAGRVRALKSQTLPHSFYTRSQSFPTVKSPPILSPGSSEDSEEDYEPLDDLPTPLPKPRNKPPPLPSNHPSRAPPPPLKPKPRRRSDMSSPDLQHMQPALPNGDRLLPRNSKPPLIKKRSNTLPAESMHHLPSLSSQESFILTPVRIISAKMLSTPSCQETIYPNGICCCKGMNDRLVVTDVYNHCLRILDSGGNFIEKIGREGRSGGQFKEPSAVAVDSDSNLFVTERDNPRAQKFTATGKYVTKFGQKTLLGSVLGDPMGVAITTNDSVLITDWDKSEICIFSNSGKVLDVIENNLFKFPAGLAINHKGNVLVSDRGNHCIWEISIRGDVVQRIGSKGELPGQLFFPYGVLVLSNRSILISESGNNRISLFSESGEFVRCFGEKGSGPGQFDHPRYMCENSSGEVVVVDQMNQRLQVFRLD